MLRYWPLILIILLFSLIYVFNSWVGDDWYMGLRSIRNFVDGLGITWNLGERTQLFTCPLWMMVFTPFYFVTGESFFTTLSVQYVLGLFLYFRLFKHLKTISFLTLSSLLLLSSSFTDYQSSGTESALSLLLWSLFLTAPTQKSEHKDKYPEEKLIWAALLIFNRLDFILILFPWIFLLSFKEKKYRDVGYIIIPSLLWSIFSLFYFGLPLPTTFYAKITNSISLWYKFNLGISYYMTSFEYDPLLALAILFFIVLIFKKKSESIHHGVAIYLIYLLMVGGDFMAGRLLTPVYLIILFFVINIFNDSSISMKWPFVLISAGLMLSFLGVKSPLIPLSKNKVQFLKNGVADEKYYYASLGNSALIRILYGNNFYQKMEEDGKKSGQLKSFDISYVIGMSGFFSHPGHYILEPSGIGSPYMIFLPTIRYARQGHYLKRIPKELIDYYRDNIPLPEGQLKNYINKWQLILSGPLFSLERLKAIWDINTLDYKKELSDYWENPEAYRKAKGKGVERLIL